MKSFKEDESMVQGNTAIIKAQPIVRMSPSVRVCVRDYSENRSPVMIFNNSNPTLTSSASIDNRKGNHGSSARAKCTMLEKARIMIFFEESSLQITAARFVRERKLGKRFEKNLGIGKNGQRFPPVLIIILMKASDDRHKNCKHIINGIKCTKSLFQLVENELRKMIKFHWSKGWKVSGNFIKINNKNLMMNL